MGKVASFLVLGAIVLAVLISRKKAPAPEPVPEPAPEPAPAPEIPLGPVPASGSFPPINVEKVRDPPFYELNSIALDKSGNVYVTDLSGYLYTIEISTGKTTSAYIVNNQQDRLLAVALDKNNNKYVAFSNMYDNNTSVYKFDAKNNPEILFTIPQYCATLNLAAHIDAKGKTILYAADAALDGVYKFDFTKSNAVLMNVNTPLSYPTCVAIDKDGIIYVADGSNLVQVVDPITGDAKSLKILNKSYLSYVSSVDVDSLKNVYVLDLLNNILKIDDKGNVLKLGTSANPPFQQISELTVDEDGNVYIIVNYPKHLVCRIDAITGLVTNI